MAETALAEIGHNRPPLTPYEACKLHIEDLMIEARNWCDGAKVENQDQADVVSRLIEDFRLAHQAADDARKTENEPFDAGKAEVQARYSPLIADTKTVKGKTVLAGETLKAALKPFLDAERERKAAIERAAQEETQRAAQAAADAMRAATPDDLEAREAAEDLVEAARLAEKNAARAANDKAQAHGGSRALGLKTYFKPYLTDRKAALMHYAANRPDDLVAFLVGLAEADVREGKRTIPGFDVREETRL
jgi:hypothetical protein